MKTKPWSEYIYLCPECDNTMRIVGQFAYGCDICDIFQFYYVKEGKIVSKSNEAERNRNELLCEAIHAWAEGGNPDELDKAVGIAVKNYMDKKESL